MGRHQKVEIQKGTINPAEKVMNTLSYAEKVSEQRAENELRRSYQRMTLHEPKTGRK